MFINFLSSGYVWPPTNSWFPFTELFWAIVNTISAPLCSTNRRLPLNFNTPLDPRSTSITNGT